MSHWRTRSLSKARSLFTRFRNGFIVVIAVFVSILGTYSFTARFSSTQGARVPCSEYRYTNQNLDCAKLADSVKQLQSLDSELDQVTRTYVDQGRAVRVSVWVRDLVTNQPAGSHEFEAYAPASLLKVPLLITYLKVAEIEPSLLSVALPYTPSAVLNSSSQDYQPTSTLAVGGSYTVDNLLQRMIVDSDNNATALLLAHIDSAIYNNTLVDLGLRIPSDGSGATDFVSAKTYANVFRILYNASYLSRDDSEKALALMASSSFTGIAAPLPTSVTVAHKFGEREVDASSGTAQLRELHDCGIVYKSPDPYSICIMTEGTHFNDLLSVIQDLSKFVYQRM